MPLLLVLVGAVAVGCGGPDATLDGREPPAGAPRGAPSDLREAELWLSFDDPGVAYDGETEFPNATGGPSVGRVVTGNGGTVESVRGVDGRGQAVAFPERCDGAGCPRAMVEVPPDRALDPGGAPFSWGASVWLAADQTTAGSNIVQRGRYGTVGGQWKLQVDGEDGRPSCVLRSDQDVLTVRSDVSIADGAWHDVVCRRGADALTIEVDGTVERQAGRVGVLRSEDPIRIGSPGVADDDDQFHGRIDDVFLVIDPVG